MTALAVTHPTLLDHAKRTDPDGQIAAIVELLQQDSGLLAYLPWVEGNLPTGHRTTVRTGIAAPTWRKLYGGVQPTKSTTAQITDTCGSLESYGEVDKALADLNGNTAAFRLSEERAFIEGMKQEFLSTFFYGNEGSEPEAFTGLGPRFNDQSAGNGDNILTSAATPDGTDNTSIWLMALGEQTVHGIFPKGSKAGLQVTDKGQVTLENVDGNGGRMEAYRTHYRWDCGLCVRDWRAVVRVQFDLEDIIASGSSGPALDAMMRKAMRRIPDAIKAMGKLVWVANRDALDALDLQSASKTTLAFRTIEDAQGKLVDTFLGAPIVRCDAILSNESGI